MKLVRLGPDDMHNEEGLGDLCEMLHKEYAYPSTWSHDHFFACMRAVLAAGLGYFAVVTEMGVPVGICGGTISADPYGAGDQIATEMFWYVHPQHRRGGVGAMIFDDWEAWARERGAARMTMCHLADLNPEIEGAYLRLGFRPLEVHYWKELA